MHPPEQRPHTGLELLHDIIGDSVGTRIGACGRGPLSPHSHQPPHDASGVGASDARFRHGDGTGAMFVDGHGFSVSPDPRPNDWLREGQIDLSDDSDWPDIGGQGDGLSDRPPDAWLAAHHLALEHDLARLPRALRAQLAQQHAPSRAVALDLARTHGLRTLASTGLPSR